MIFIPTSRDRIVVGSGAATAGDPYPSGPGKTVVPAVSRRGPRGVGVGWMWGVRRRCRRRVVRAPQDADGCHLERPTGGAHPRGRCLRPDRHGRNGGICRSTRVSRTPAVRSLEGSAGANRAPSASEPNGCGWWSVHQAQRRRCCGLPSDVGGEKLQADASSRRHRTSPWQGRTPAWA